MDLFELKKKTIKEELKITDGFGRIFSFIDFANVNNWFSKDNQDCDNKPVDLDEFIEIDLEGLKNFSNIFSERIKLYYGEDPKNQKSLGFTYLLRKIFAKKNVVTKDLQKIKHYLEIEDLELFKDYSKIDMRGVRYIEIRKCNFDVEIAVDAYKMIDHYDTFCIFSGDADFVYLNNYLRKKGKKIIIIKGGYILDKLKKSADLVINAQDIKKHITHVQKQRPD